MQTKVILNDCVGLIGISAEAEAAFSKEASIEESDQLELGEWDKLRINPRLVKIVESLGDKANGINSHLKVVTIRGDWEIKEDNGKETIIQKETK